MASGFLKAKGLLARGGESLQLWWGFANLCFYSRLNSWQVPQVLAVELLKSAQLPEHGIAKHRNCRDKFKDFGVLCLQKEKDDCAVLLAHNRLHRRALV